MPTLLQKQNLQKIQEYWVVSTYSNTIKLLMSLILYNYRTFFFTISPIASNTTKASEIFFQLNYWAFLMRFSHQNNRLEFGMVLSHPLFVTNTTPQLMIAMMCIYVTRGDAKSGRWFMSTFLVNLIRVAHEFYFYVVNYVETMESIGGGMAALSKSAVGPIWLGRRLG